MLALQKRNDRHAMEYSNVAAICILHKGIWCTSITYSLSFYEYIIFLLECSFIVTHHSRFLLAIRSASVKYISFS